MGEESEGGRGEVGRRAKSTENDSSLGEMGSRRDFESAARANFPRPPAGLREFSVQAGSAAPLGISSERPRKSTWLPIDSGLTGGTAEVTRITEIRRLHSE